MNVTEGVVAVLTTSIVIGLPMLALTLRFALKPVLDAYLKLKESNVRPVPELESLRMRVAALEAVWEKRLGGGTLEPTALPANTVERVRS